MAHDVIENVEDRVGDRVIRRKIIKTDDSQYPSDYRYALHYGYTDGRGVILRYDTKTKHQDGTSVTRAKVSNRSTFLEW